MCMRVGRCVHKYTHVSMHADTRVHTQPHVCMHVQNTLVHGYTCVQMHTGTHMYTWIHSYKHVHPYRPAYSRVAGAANTFGPSLRSFRPAVVLPALREEQALPPGSCGPPAAAQGKRRPRPVPLSQITLPSKPPPCTLNAPNSLSHLNQKSPSKKL